jgi:hypothetical protein
MTIGLNEELRRSMNQVVRFKFETIKKQIAKIKHTKNPTIPEFKYYVFGTHYNNLSNQLTHFLFLTALEFHGVFLTDIMRKISLTLSTTDSIIYI